MTRQKKAFELTMFALFSTQYQNRSRYLQKHVYFFIHQSNQRPVVTAPRPDGRGFLFRRT